jgi:hypothetical protein
LNELGSFEYDCSEEDSCGTPSSQIVHEYSRPSLLMLPSEQEVVKPSAFKMRLCGLDIVFNLAPIRFTDGIATFTMITDTLLVLQASKKLHRENVNEKLPDFCWKSFAGIGVGGEMKLRALFLIKSVTLLTISEFVPVTLIAILFQFRPPFPTEPVKSKTKLSQELDIVGPTTLTVGTRAFSGASICTNLIDDEVR